VILDLNARKVEDSNQLRDAGFDDGSGNHGENARGCTTAPKERAVKLAEMPRTWAPRLRRARKAAARRLAPSKESLWRLSKGRGVTVTDVDAGQPGGNGGFGEGDTILEVNRASVSRWPTSTKQCVTSATATTLLLVSAATTRSTSQCRSNRLKKGIADISGARRSRRRRKSRIGWNG